MCFIKSPKVKGNYWLVTGVLTFYGNKARMTAIRTKWLGHGNSRISRGVGLGGGVVESLYRLIFYNMQFYSLDYLTREGGGITQVSP